MVRHLSCTYDMTHKHIQCILLLSLYMYVYIYTECFFFCHFNFLYNFYVYHRHPPSHLPPFSSLLFLLSGYIILACGNDRQFKCVCECLDLPHIHTDPRFAKNRGRVENREILIPILEQAFLKKTTTDWVDGLVKLNVPCGPINDLKGVYDHPQVKSRQIWRNIDNKALTKRHRSKRQQGTNKKHANNANTDMNTTSSTKTNNNSNSIDNDKDNISLPISEPSLFPPIQAPTTSSPLRFSHSPVQYRLPPPLLGQHTEEVEQELRRG